MSIYLFLASLSIAVIGPILAISYLRPILVKVLVGLCDAEGGAEFWVRSAYLLAICGTVLLMLSFGRFEASIDLADSLQRSLLVVFTGIFASTAFIARNVWAQVRAILRANAGLLPGSADRSSAAIPRGNKAGIGDPEDAM